MLLTFTQILTHPSARQHTPRLTAQANDRISPIETGFEKGGKAVNFFKNKRSAARTTDFKCFCGASHNTDDKLWKHLFTARCENGKEMMEAAGLQSCKSTKNVPGKKGVAKSSKIVASFLENIKSARIG